MDELMTSILLKTIYNFNAILFKISIIYFTEIVRKVKPYEE